MWMVGNMYERSTNDYRSSFKFINNDTCKTISIE